MKKILVIVLLLLSQLDYVYANDDNNDIDGFFDNQQILCNDLVDISMSKYDNLKVYHIMCKDNAGNIRIYNYTPTQTVMTYYIEKDKK